MRTWSERKTGWLFIVVSALSFSPVVGQQQNLRLDDCVRQALEANYSIKIVKNQENVAENNVTYAPFLPTVDLNLKQNQNINDGKTISAPDATERILNNSVSDGLSGGVVLNWRLFDGLGMFTTYEKYKEILAIGELNTQMSIENLIVTVSSYYYNVIAQHSKLDAARHSLGLSNERYNEAKDKYMLGVLSGLELQQAKIDLNADSSNFMKQKELLKSAYISLNASMNADLQQAMYVDDSIVLLPPLSLKELHDKTIDLNTTLQIARKDQKISALDLKLARAVLFPTLDLNTGYNYNRTKSPSATTTLNRTNGFYWGFSLNVNVFNQLENRRKIRNAQLDIENTELSYQETELQLLADLAQLYNTYENNLQIVNFENESAYVAFENLDAALEKYKLGSLSGIEFREFQRSYIDAVDRKISAIYQAKASELSLQLISGDIKLK